MAFGARLERLFKITFSLFAICTFVGCRGSTRSSYNLFICKALNTTFKSREQVKTHQPWNLQRFEGTKSALESRARQQQLLHSETLTWREARCALHTW
jgi:hypothetical protein